MSELSLVQVLEARERELHDHATRASGERLAQILHPEFAEFGRTGNIFTRALVIAQLPNDTRLLLVHAQDFAAKVIAPDVALLTYRSAHLKDDGTLERHTLRSSVWRFEDGRWQMFFHQGTPTPAFTKV
jgi:hypothetical protein